MIRFYTVQISTVSFNLGGEKLKAYRSHLAALVAVSFIMAGFFGIASPLSAQTVPPYLYTDDVQEDAVLDQPVVTTTIDETALLFDAPLPSAQPQGRPAIFVVIQMVLVLGLAALAIYGVVFFFKRISRPQESKDPHLKLLARVPLSADSYAAVVSVGGKAWLVGGGSGGLNLISEIDDPETLETLLLDDARRNAEAELKGFVDFHSLFKRFRGSSAGKPQAKSSFAENLRKQRERVRGL